MQFKKRLFPILALVVFAGAGCDPYLAHLIEGQFASIDRIVSVEDAINDPALGLTDAERMKLAYTPSIREFAINELGLTPGDAYTVFDPNGSTPAAYVLAGSAPDALMPYIWIFPFVGVSPVKGFFDQEMGQREAEMLQMQGYDVLYARADGFSTLGFFADPVRQSNLALDLADYAELLIHEMTHSTYFAPGDADYNESSATFTGREGALRWLEATFGAESNELSQARLRFADKAVFDAYVVELYNRATAYYADAKERGLSRDEIIVERETLFDELGSLFETDYLPQLSLPDEWQFAENQTINNAIILAGVRYQSGLELYEDVLEILNGDYRAMIGVFTEAANQPNSREYLQNWVAERR